MDIVRVDHLSIMKRKFPWMVGFFVKYKESIIWTEVVSRPCLVSCESGFGILSQEVFGFSGGHEPLFFALCKTTPFSPQLLACSHQEFLS